MVTGMNLKSLALLSKWNVIRNIIRFPLYWDLFNSELMHYVLYDYKNKCQISWMKLTAEFKSTAQKPPGLWVLPGCESSRAVSPPGLWVLPGCEASRAVSPPGLWVGWINPVGKFCMYCRSWQSLRFVGVQSTPLCLWWFNQNAIEPGYPISEKRAHRLATAE